MKIPPELKYSPSHEWIKIEEDGSAIIGITDHGQDALGDLIYVELAQVGDIIESGMELAIVESMKAATDICSPVSGEVIEINRTLSSDPKIVNKSPFNDGWFLRLKLSNSRECDNLIGPEEYSALVEGDL